jgi:hypothetical protein
MHGRGTPQHYSTTANKKQQSMLAVRWHCQLLWRQLNFATHEATDTVPSITKNWHVKTTHGGNRSIVRLHAGAVGEHSVNIGFAINEI